MGGGTEVVGTDRRGRRRRAAIALGILAAAAGVVGVSRVGLDEDATAPARPAPTGAVVTLAADATTLVALVDVCLGGPETCGPRLVVSPDTGRTWQERTVPVPGLRAGEVTRWRSFVRGDALTIEDEERGVVHHSRDSGRSWATRPIRPGPRAGRVPVGVEDRVGLSQGVPTWVDPVSGARRTLAGRLPVAPRAVRAEAGALWVAGLDRRGRYATAVSRDGGATWATSVLTGARVEPDLVVGVVPLPRGDASWFVSGYADPDRGMLVFDVWFVPARGRDPVQVTPDRSLALDSGLGLSNGLLLAGDGVPGFTLSPGGTVESATMDVLERVGQARNPVRGPQGDLVAIGVGGDRPGVVVSGTGDPEDWEWRPVSW